MHNLTGKYPVRRLAICIAILVVLLMCFSPSGMLIGQAQTGPLFIGPNPSQVPCIRVELYSGVISAESWPIGYVLTWQIDDPTNGPGIPYTTHDPVWGNDVPFNFGDDFLKPGMIVTITNGYTTKSMVLSSGSVNAVDYEKDTIHGTAEPGSTVKIKGTAHDDFYHILYEGQVTADSGGNWFADFGTGPQVYDIIEGSDIYVQVFDEDGDYTQILERKQIPEITVDLTFDNIYASYWPNASPVVLTIDDPANGIGIDYSKSIDHAQDYFEIDLQGIYDIANGQAIVLTDGVFTKTILPNLSIDPTTDYLAVSGRANPSTRVSVDFRGLMLFSGSFATADSNGNWSVNFRDPYSSDDYAIGPNSEIVASQRDINLNTSKVRRNIPFPQIAANLTLDLLTAWDWPVSTALTITVDDPSNGTGIDFSGSATMCGLAEAPQLMFDFGEFQVKPGQTVTVTDGIVSKVLNVPNLSVTSIDTNLGLISGTSSPYGQVNLFREKSDGEFTEWASADVDASGNWSFTSDSLKPGTRGRVQRRDAEYDITMVDWVAGSPSIITVNPKPIVAKSTGLTLTVNGSNFTESSIVNWNGNPLPTTYINSTQLTALISDSDLVDIGSALITVSNPVTGGSNAVSVSIVTFADVVPPSWYYRYVEGFYGKGITTGCNVAPYRYCPDRAVTRAEMAVFILRSLHADALPYTPSPDPADVDVFADLPVATKEWMKPWIEEFYGLGMTTGCASNPMQYCPERQVTRAEMAVFVLRAMHGADYQPPAVSVSSFSDVPVTGKEWMMPWIEQFYVEGLTTGCKQVPTLQYCPEASVTRAEMATFLDRAFGFPQLP